MKHLALLIAIALLPIGTIASAVADDSLYGHNLIANGDAEAGDGLPGAGNIPGWTTDANTAVGIISVQYNYQFPTGNYPDSGVPGPRHRGKNFFAGGTNSAESVATQPVDISAILADVDAHSVHYALEGWLGGNGNKADYATLTAQFFDAGGTPLGSAVIGPVTVEQRRGVTGMYYRIATGFLPVGTRRIIVAIRCTRFQGSNNDGYLDALSLVLRKQTIH
jgi:hypothetical protein